MTPRVAILDYGCGNLGSVVNAVRKVGGEPQILVGPEPHDAPPLAGATGHFTHIILPGQGAFKQLSRATLGHLNAARTADTPILGICLGMQLMCEGSEEAPGVKGLGWFPYTVERLKAKRLPHVGWNTVQNHAAHDYYFCHSYAVTTAWSARPPWYAVAFYEEQGFAAMLRDSNLWAVQFHPEKSGKAGLELLREFLNLHL